MNEKHIDSHDNQIALKKLQLLYRQSFLSASLNIVVASLLTYAVWQEVPGTFIGAWLGIITLVSISRMLLSLAFTRRNVVASQQHKWHRYYLFTLLLTSLTWGAGCSLMMMMVSPLSQAVICFFVIGVAGGVVVTHSLDRLLILTSIPTMLAPTALLALFLGNTPLQLVGLTIIIFMLTGVKATFPLMRTFQNKLLLIRELHELKQKVEQLANIDPLTNLNNRHSFLHLAQQQLNLCERLKVPVTLILADVDDFKLINDENGHVVGDSVLIYIANLVNNSRRDSDICARLDGEEFVILLSDTDKENAKFYAERLRKQIQENPFIQNGKTLSLSVSMGVASDSNDIDELLRQSDVALSQAKQQGKNQFVEGQLIA